MTTRPRQFDLIAFDWDGTLFDSTQIITRCIQEAVVDVGGVKPTQEAASYVIGLPSCLRWPTLRLMCRKRNTRCWGSATAFIT